MYILSYLAQALLNSQLASQEFSSCLCREGPKHVALVKLNRVHAWLHPTARVVFRM